MVDIWHDPRSVVFLHTSLHQYRGSVDNRTYRMAPLRTPLPTLAPFLAPLHESHLQQPHQLIQPLNPHPRMPMPLQLPIALIHQQHRRRPRLIACRHIINRITDLHPTSILTIQPKAEIEPLENGRYHNQPLPSILQPPFPCHMQDPRGIRFRRAEIPRHDRSEGLVREEGLQEMRDRAAGVVSASVSRSFAEV